MPTDSGPREIGIGTAARLARRGAAPMLLGLTLLAAGVQPARPEAAAVAGRAAPYPIGMDLPSRLHARLVSPSGALQMTFRDIAVPARGWPLEFVRTYNSDNRWNSGLGAGWSWSYGIFLVPQGEAVTVRESDGLESRYTRAADGSWRPSDGRLDHVLRREAAGDYVRTYADGRGERFSPEGLLVERLGRSGVALTIAYKDKVPVRVTTPDGRGITIEWGPNGLIAALVDPLGRRTEFRYDQHDRPVRVTDGAKRWTAFIYDKKGLLVGVHAPPLGAVAAVYDVFDRVSFLLGPGLLQTRFEHEAGPGETDSRIVATDAEDRRTVLDLRRTADGSLVALTDGLGQRVAVSRQNRAARFTLPDGREAAMAFDEGGRASSFRDFTGKEQNLDAVRAAVQRFAPREPAQRHDARGFPQTVEVDGETLTPRYDEIGRLTENPAPAGGAERFHYDAADRLERHVDRTGRQTRYTYDWGDRVLSLVDARGLKTDFAYDPLGLREIRTEGQPTTAFDYDKSGLLLRTRAAGRQVSFEYDAARRITAIRDPHGNVTGFEYDALGNPTAVKTPNGRRTEFEYDSNGALAHVRDGANSLAFDRPAPGTLDIRRNRDRIDRAIADKDGLTTVTLYRGREVARSIRDWNGRVVAERQVGLGESRQEHDAAGRLVASGASGRMVRYAHDANGRLESISAPDGDVWKLDYDAAGRLAGAASRAGPAFKLAYDAAGDLVSVEDARGARREAAYDKAGRLILQRDALGETRYEYDAQGRLTGLTAPDGARSTFAYDVDGRVAGRRLVSGNFRLEWQYGYDGFGALARIVHPDGVEEAREYDAFGRLAVQRIGAEQLSFAYDAEGRLVRAGRGKHNETFAYDPLGRLVAANGRTAFEYPEDGSPLASAEIDARGGRWLKRYDASGQLTALTDPGGAARRYEWSAGGLLRAQEDDDGRRIELARDAVGRLTGYGIRGGAAVRYEYDAAGALAAIGRAGRSVRYARDRLGRIASETTEGETARRYRYDALGRLVEVEDGLGKQVFTHGPGGELLSATDAFGRTIRYEYDAIGRRIALTGPGGERITYRYGPDGRVAAVGGADGETSLAADPASDSVRITLPGGDVLHATEDAHARLSALRLSGRDGTPLLDRRYERDAAGDTLAVTQSERTWRYRYDAAGRLAEATDPDGQRESYHYDASGNIVGKGATKLTYDKAFRPTAIDADAVTHDADGNLAGLGDAVTLTHDAHGRVVSARLRERRARALPP
ncbi:MAG: DUF6531 domain-containing protein [Xanthobacteraceae bacterium]|nr:DUF6531 domain-containing protein [Xanthobacteraceae bacterium]